VPAPTQEDVDDRIEDRGNRGQCANWLVQPDAAAQRSKTDAPDAELIVWDELAATPPFSEDDEEHPPKVVRGLRATIADADAVLIVTPEYNSSIPGQLKNALDWASRPFPDNVLRGKPVAVIGASPSPGGAGRAQAETRTVLARVGAHVLPDGLSVPHA
jgi:chromate reductase, NAD(P)H dehydrogenase (quinone)